MAPMIKVKCYSGSKVNERPISFSLCCHDYQVIEIIDRWYGENSVHFKIKADDGNIYLLKYDEWQDQWDLVFYQDPQRLKTLLPKSSDISLHAPSRYGQVGAEQSTTLN